MPDGLLALFWGVVTFSLLIVIHEGGHFLAARAFGVKVHEFMVGLPGPALRFHGKKTDYGVTAVPFGGYVRIAGMEPGPEDPLLGPVLAATTRRGSATAAEIAADLGIAEKDAEGVLAILMDWDALTAGEGDAFTSRFAASDALDETALLDRARSVTYRALPTWKRVVVLSMGVILNLVVAVLVFTVVVSAFGVLTTKVSEVSPGSAAERAGIAVGDRVTEIAGEEIKSWDALAGTIAEHKPGESVTIAFERNGEMRQVTAVLGRNPETGTGQLGVSPSIEKPTLLRALTESISYIGLTFKAVLQFFNPETARVAVSQSASVIGASYIAAEAARTSALSYAAIVAMLSLSLGVMNIFPIPPLDGGKIAVELIERFFGRQLPRRLSLGLSIAGTSLLFALIGYLVYADVLKYILR